MKIISATQARKNFFQLIRLAGKPGKGITVTLANHPPVRMISEEELEGWIETVEIMSDPELVKAIEEGKADMKAGRVVPWEKVKKDLHKKK